MSKPRIVEVSSYTVQSYSGGKFQVALRFADGDKLGHLVLTTDKLERSTIPRQLVGFWKQSEAMSGNEYHQFFCIDPKYKKMVEKNWS